MVAVAAYLQFVPRERTPDAGLIDVAGRLGPDGPVTPPVERPELPQVTALAPAGSGLPGASLPPKANFTIVQIGDSHTAADFFTGRVRDLLQARYGEGGIYLPPGLPHPGIRSNVFRIAVSEGWEYRSLARATDKDAFWLTGFIAQTVRDHAEISFSSTEPVRFDAIDVGFVTSPGGGMAEILLDGDAVGEVNLAGADGQPVFLRLMPTGGAVDSFRELTVRSASTDQVALSGVYVDQRTSGISYVSVGFPGATARVATQIDAENLSYEMGRLGADIIVVAFGTNEGFDDNLDIDIYREMFRNLLRKLQQARPGAELVVVGPAAGARETRCGTGPSACTRATTGASCWVAPVKLASVRAVQREVAEAEGAQFWDWSSALPDACEIERGSRGGEPPLYAADRVHLTIAGYRHTAEAFAEFLTPIIDSHRQN